MLVEKRMSRPVLTIPATLPVQEALAQMRKDKVRRYPVVDKRGKMVGIVTQNDLLNASPSEATSLSVWEVNYLLSKITVERVMKTDVITVCPDCTIEEAAKIMADNHIGGLPVVDDGKLVGIITETDLFKVLLEMLGARIPGVRLTVDLKNTPGTLHDLTGVISGQGGNIVGLGHMLGDSTETHTVMAKITGVNIEDLKKAVKPVVEDIVDIREAS